MEKTVDTVLERHGVGNKLGIGEGLDTFDPELFIQIPLAFPARPSGLPTDFTEIFIFRLQVAELLLSQETRCSS